MTYLRTLPQYLIPQHALTRCIGKLINCQQQNIKNKIIQWFIQRYGVDLSEALITDAKAFNSFNEFFTRYLKADARPIVLADTSIACPNDGAVSQVGDIQQGLIFQAKGRDFSLLELVGKDDEVAQQFARGKFATLYLAPKDYHRVHMPVSGTLKKMIYVPGKLFAVKPTTVNTVPNLFARNERVIAVFDTHLGPMAIILVGAIIVGSIHTVWSGQISPTKTKQILSTDYSAKNIHLQKGEEMGHFQLGSTAILLFPENTITWNQTLKPGSTIRLGQEIAKTN